MHSCTTTTFTLKRNPILISNDSPASDNQEPTLCVCGLACSGRFPSVGSHPVCPLSVSLTECRVPGVCPHGSKCQGFPLFLAEGCSQIRRDTWWCSPLAAVRVWVSMWTCVSTAPHGCLVVESQGHGVTFLRTLPHFTAYLPCGLPISPHPPTLVPAGFMDPAIRAGMECVLLVSVFVSLLPDCVCPPSPGCRFYMFLAFSSGLQAMCPPPPPQLWAAD